MKTIRVLLAEDHHVVRTAVAALLSKEPDIEVVGEVAEGTALMATVEKSRPDIVLMDAQMPNHRPVAAAERLRALFPEVQIVVLSAYDLPEYVVGLLRAGAIGYVLKDDPAEMLVRAVRAAAQGEDWVSPRVAKVLVERVRSQEQSPITALTERETEVLQLMAHGRTNAEIARQLVISEHTVKNHVSSIFRKLNVETRVDAVLHAISAGLVTTGEIRDELDA
jgi:DNA-binding NarL/FixJ family response regulator